LFGSRQKEIDQLITQSVSDYFKWHV